MTTADDLFDLLPAHLANRDEGLLAALLTAIAGEASVLDRDLDELYADSFVETARAWALPYLADLLGIDDLPDGPEMRAVIAHTIDYRRRKGTVGATELMARDAAGAAALAVEFQQRLAVTAHVNHVRLNRPATAPLRVLDERNRGFARGALDGLPRTAEARRSATGRGRYGIGRVGVFSFPTAVLDVVDAAATPSASGWWVHPAAVPRPLFARPRPPELDRRTEEADLPVPLRPRRLLALLQAARAGEAGDLPIAVTVVTAAGPVPLPPDRLRVWGLEDLDAAGGAAAGWRAVVDAGRGVLALYLDGAAVPAGDARVESVLVTHAYGGRADVGAEPYDHSLGLRAALLDDPYRGVGAPSEIAERASVPVEGVAAALPALAARLTAGATGALLVTDCGAWAGAVTADVGAGTRLVLGGRDRPVLRGTVEISGGAGASFVLDGVTVLGDLVVRSSGMVGLTVSQATVTGRIRVLAATATGATDLTVRVRGSLVGGVELPVGAPALALERSILSPEVGGGPVAGQIGPTVSVSDGHLEVVGCTLRGGVVARTLYCTDAIFDGAVTVRHRQVGCARFSYFPQGTATPRRFRCVVPGADGVPTTAHPGYVSVDPGDPAFLALSPAAPEPLRRGSEHGDEPGIDAHLRLSGRISTAGRMVAGSLPAGADSYLWPVR